MADDPGDITDLMPQPQDVIHNIRSGFIDVLDLIVDNIKRNAPVKTGWLRQNYKWEIVSESQLELTALVFNNVEYAPHVEYGTRHMEARHPMLNGIEQSRARAERLLQQSLRISS